MAKTLDDYRNVIRATLMTEVNAEDHWPNTRLDNIINQARRWSQGEILTAFDSQFDVEVQLSTDVDGNLNLPADFITEKRLVKGVAGAQGNWIEVNLIHSTAWKMYSPLIAPLTDAPRKETWAFVGDKIKPQFVGSIASGQQYVLTYAKMIADFTIGGVGSQAETMSDRFFDMTCYRGTELCAALGEEWNTSTMYGKLAREESAKLKSEAAKRSLSRVEMIQDVMGYSRDEDPWPLADV